MDSSTSPLLMVFTQDTTTTGGSTVHQAGSSNNNNQDACKSQQQLSSKLPRGRKPSKSTKSPVNKNKPTRRGMGVEKLERWLHAEKWASGLPAEVPSSGFSLTPHCHTHHHQFQTPTPHLIIPVASSPSVFVGSDLLMSRLASSSSSFMAASSKVISTLDGGGGVCGKELSSIPKVMLQCHDDQCDASFYSSKEMQGMLLGGMNQDKLVFPSSLIQNHHMLSTGLMNNGHNNVGSEMKDSNSKFMKQKDSEVMGITKSLAASSSTSTTLKEYEFFPPEKDLKEYEFFAGTNGGGSSYLSSSEQPNHYNTEPAASSYFIPSDYSNQYNASTSTSTAIDLSLKL